VRAELPGMKRDDVNVELVGNELRVTGEVSQEGEGKALRHRQGKFAYRASLPSDADPAKIDAQLTDGVLTVRLPKAPQAPARRIEVRTCLAPLPLPCPHRSGQGSTHVRPPRTGRR